MLAYHPILACRGPQFTNGELTVIYSVLITWLIAALLSLINLGFILTTTVRKAFIFGHLGIFAVYVGLAFLLYHLAFADLKSDSLSMVVWSLPFVIPLMVTAHFIYLLRFWRRMNRKP